MLRRHFTSIASDSDNGGSVDIPGYIDLGLSVMWAECNLGAETPVETGLFFSQGNVTGHMVKNGIIQDGYSFTEEAHNLTDGVNLKKNGTLGRLSRPYDAVYSNILQYLNNDTNYALVYEAHIPTIAEWTELIDNTTHSIVYIENTPCIQFTSIINNNSIVIPIQDNYAKNNTVYGGDWSNIYPDYGFISSTISTYKANMLAFVHYEVDPATKEVTFTYRTDNNQNWEGRPIRGVVQKHNFYSKAAPVAYDNYSIIPGKLYFIPPYMIDNYISFGTTDNIEFEITLYSSHKCNADSVLQKLPAFSYHNPAYHTTSLSSGTVKTFFNQSDDGYVYLKATSQDLVHIAPIKLTANYNSYLADFQLGEYADTSSSRYTCFCIKYSDIYNKNLIIKRSGSRMSVYIGNTYPVYSATDEDCFYNKSLLQNGSATIDAATINSWEDKINDLGLIFITCAKVAGKIKLTLEDVV